MNVDSTSQRLQTINILNNVYANPVILEGELSSLEMQASVGKNYVKLQFAFINFRSILKKTCQQQKVSGKPKRQETLTGIFSRACSSKF